MLSPDNNTPYRTIFLTPDATVLASQGYLLSNICRLIVAHTEVISNKRLNKIAT